MKSLILSDIHSNIAALDAVLEAEKHWDEVLFLGDAVVAGPCPEEVLQRLKSLDGVFIRGNHDPQPFAKKCSMEDANPDKQYMCWTKNQISAEGKEFLDSLEDSQIIQREGLLIRLHHGDFPKPVGGFPDGKGKTGLSKLLFRIYRKLLLPEWDSRIWPDSHKRIFEALAEKFPEPIILMGHCHVQYRIQVGNTTFINPGAVGQPRLGQPLALYAVLEDGEFQLKSAEYDVEATCRALDEVPIDEDFKSQWKKGYREGRLPSRYGVRDFEPLIRAGYR